MASLASVVAPPDSSADMTDLDDASETETSDLSAAISELASVLGLSADAEPALQSALEAVVLSIK